MKRLVKGAVLSLVALVIVLAVVAFAGASTGVGTGPHDRMDPVSHSDYELHKSIGHVP